MVDRSIQNPSTETTSATVLARTTPAQLEPDKRGKCDEQVMMEELIFQVTVEEESLSKRAAGDASAPSVRRRYDEDGVWKPSAEVSHPYDIFDRDVRDRWSLFEFMRVRMIDNLRALPNAMSGSNLLVFIWEYRRTVGLSAAAKVYSCAYYFDLGCVDRMSFVEMATYRKVLVAVSRKTYRSMFSDREFTLGVPVFEDDEHPNQLHPNSHRNVADRILRHIVARDWSPHGVVGPEGIGVSEGFGLQPAPVALIFGVEIHIEEDALPRLPVVISGSPPGKKRMRNDSGGQHPGAVVVDLTGAE